MKNSHITQFTTKTTTATKVVDIFFKLNVKYYSTFSSRRTRKLPSLVALAFIIPEPTAKEKRQLITFKNLLDHGTRIG